MAPHFLPSWDYTQRSIHQRMPEGRVISALQVPIMATTHQIGFIARIDAGVAVVATVARIDAGRGTTYVNAY